MHYSLPMAHPDQQARQERQGQLALQDQRVQQVQRAQRAQLAQQDQLDQLVQQVRQDRRPQQVLQPSNHLAAKASHRLQLLLQKLLILARLQNH